MDDVAKIGKPLLIHDLYFITEIREFLVNFCSKSGEFLFQDAPGHRLACIPFLHRESILALQKSRANGVAVLDPMAFPCAFLHMMMKKLVNRLCSITLTQIFVPVRRYKSIISFIQYYMGSPNYGRLLTDYPQYADEIHVAYRPGQSDGKTEPEESNGKHMTREEILLGLAASEAELGRLNGDGQGVRMAYGSLKDKIGSLLAGKQKYGVVQALGRMQQQLAELVKRRIADPLVLETLLQDAASTLEKMEKEKVNAPRKRIDSMSAYFTANLYKVEDQDEDF